MSKVKNDIYEPSILVMGFRIQTLLRTTALRYTDIGGFFFEDKLAKGFETLAS